MENMTVSEDLEKHLKHFSQGYEKIHIPLTTVICIFGILSHPLNIFILTRKQMRKAINTLLTGLSVAQLTLATNYVTYLGLNFLRNRCILPGFSNGVHGTWYRLVSVNLSVALHTVALMHILCLAVFRFVAVKWPSKGILHCQNRHARYCSLIIYMFVPFQCVPVYLSSTVQEYVNSSCPGYDGRIYDLFFNKDLILAVFWIFGIGFKIIPSILILLLGVGLVLTIRQARKRSLRLYCAPRIWNRRLSKFTYRSTMIRTKTTRLLLAIVLICVMVELPQGILNLLVGIYGMGFATRVYDTLGEFMEMLTLLYSSVNFVLFCLMSSDFMEALTRLLIHLKGKFGKWEKERSNRKGNSERDSSWV